MSMSLRPPASARTGTSAGEGRQARLRRVLEIGLQTGYLYETQSVVNLHQLAVKYGTQHDIQVPPDPGPLMNVEQANKFVRVNRTHGFNMRAHGRYNEYTPKRPLPQQPDHTTLELYRGAYSRLQQQLGSEGMPVNLLKEWVDDVVGYLGP